MAYRLRPREELGSGIVRVAQEELDSAVEQLAERVRDDPVEAVHEARKSLKKERALLRLVRDAVGSERYRAENERLRDAGRRLSGTRDAQVAIATVDRLAERYAGQLPKAAFTRLRRALARNAPAAARGAGVRAVAQGVAAELEPARAAVPEWAGRVEGWPDVEPGLARTYRRGRDALALAAEDPSDERLHEWRKRVKDLWYHQRLLRPLWPGVMERQAGELDRLGELLGDDQDLANLRDRLAGESSLTDAVPADLDRLLELIDNRREQLQREALLLGRRVYAERPGAYRRRHARYWRAWRAEVAGEPAPALD